MGDAYFLGANSYRGFYSLFDSYLNRIAAKQVFVLKGGAGCGKSSFMKTLAEKAELRGYTVDRIFCSGDMDSLDGIRISDIDTVILDGTAPHVTEPPQVGERGFYLDLSRFYTTGIQGLSEKEAEYRRHYQRAYGWLSAAGEVAALHTLPHSVEAALIKKADKWASKHLPRFSHSSRVIEVFTEAFTGKGIVSRYEASEGMHTIALLGICSSEAVFLRELCQNAAERGCNMILCHHPLKADTLSGVIFPDLKLCLLSGKGERKLFLKKELISGWTEADRRLYYETELQRRILLRNAEKELALAKRSHDALEAAVRPYIDYAEISAFTEAFTRSLF